MGPQLGWLGATHFVYLYHILLLLPLVKNQAGYVFTSFGLSVSLFVCLHLSMITQNQLKDFYETWLVEEDQLDSGLVWIQKSFEGFFKIASNQCPSLIQHKEQKNGNC